MRKGTAWNFFLLTRGILMLIAIQLTVARFVLPAIPEVTTDRSDVTNHLYQNEVLTCQVAYKGYPTYTKFDWLKNGNIIQQNEKYKEKEESYLWNMISYIVSVNMNNIKITLYSQVGHYNLDQGHKMLTLVITDIQEEDFGEYTCRAKTQIAMDSATITFSKYVSPTGDNGPAATANCTDSTDGIIVWAERDYVLPDISATIAIVQCHIGQGLLHQLPACQGPSVSMGWKKNGEYFEYGAKYMYDTTTEGQYIMRLYIPDLDHNDFAEYTCEAYTPGGPESSKTITVIDRRNHLLAAPGVSVQTSPVHARLGARASMECHFSMFPSGEMSWWKDGSMLQPNNKFEIVEFSRYQTDRLVTQVLSIKYVQEGDFGRFSCVGKNQYGESVAEVELLLREE